MTWEAVDDDNESTPEGGVPGHWAPTVQASAVPAQDVEMDAAPTVIDDESDAGPVCISGARTERGLTCYRDDIVFDHATNAGRRSSRKAHPFVFPSEVSKELSIGRT